NARQFSRDIVSGLVPDEAETFAKLLPRLTSEQVSTAQIETAFRLLGAENTPHALALMGGIADDATRRSATASLAEGWARHEAAAACACASALPDPAQRESALRGVFRAWAETDAQGVAAKLDELSKDEAVTNDVRGDSPVKAIVRALALQD